jgi:segregation and condensation protein B
VSEEDVTDGTQMNETESAVIGDDMESDDPDDLGAPSLRAAVEALLLLADEPMSIMTLAEATRTPVDDVATIVHELAAEYTDQGRGFDLREVAGGWRFYTRAECSPLIERWVLDGQQARLTQASLETLAVIAYQQPVSRGKVSAVRGVNVDGVIKTLLTRGLIQEAGHDGESGSILYRTTSYFLERLGISSLEELPPLAEHLPDLGDLEEVMDSIGG